MNLTEMIKKFCCALGCILFCVAALGENTDMYRVSDEETLPAYDLPDGFVYVRDYVPDVIEEMRYAGTHNFTGDIVEGYEEPFAILCEKAAKQLKLAADDLRQQGYLIKIFDAYRPKRSVISFVKWSKEEEDGKTREEFYPDFKDRQELVARGYIAKNSAHSRGSAIDMTLTDLEGNDLDMGTCFDYFGEKAWHGASGLTEEQKKNRLILKNTMGKYGFRPFEQEWWHYKLLGEPYPETAFDFIVH